MTPDDSVNLSPADAEAVDALFEAAFDTTRVDEALRSRAERARIILNTLDDAGAAADRETRINVAVARVMAHTHRAEPEGEPVLIPADEEALDAWIASGHRASRIAPSLRGRAQMHERIAALVTTVPAAPADSLVNATLVRVQRAIDDEAETLRADTHRAAPRVGLAELVSVAATLLIGFSVIWPIFTTARDHAYVAACMGNFGSTANAMATYAGANRDHLPLAAASLAGNRWWDVNPEKPSSNSANLYQLVHAGYEPLGSLACPGNEHAPTEPRADDARDWRNLQEISYSYQIMYGEARPQWGVEHRTVILTDRSPVILRAVRGQVIDPVENSPNHNGAGQHLLYTDGSAQWVRSPVVNGDNIWLPAALERLIEQVSTGRGIDLEGTETPASARDIFVGP